jgi:hypothetical protein
VPLIYGAQLSEMELAELVARLRSRGTAASLAAADTVSGSRRADRSASAETSAVVRGAIVFELNQWDAWEETSPHLTALRDRLAPEAPTEPAAD